MKNTVEFAEQAKAKQTKNERPATDKQGETEKPGLDVSQLLSQVTARPSIISGVIFSSPLLYDPLATIFIKQCPLIVKVLAG